jgi:hypothetical protein
MSDELTPEQMIEKDIKAMDDSLLLIEEIKAIPSLSEEQSNTLDRNLRHLEIMLSKPHIIESGFSLSKFEAALKS